MRTENLEFAHTASARRALQKARTATVLRVEAINAS
jgi:hypothetical protein